MTLIRVAEDDDLARAHDVIAQLGPHLDRDAFVA
jgi:hypothetical protein